MQQPLYAANLIMRGVYVPAGAHDIEFIYEPLSFRLGVYISLGTVLLIVAGLIFTRSVQSKQNLRER